MSHLHIQRLVSVRDEFVTTRAALQFARLQESRFADLAEFAGIDFKFVSLAQINVEVTYLIRLFAVF